MPGFDPNVTALLVPRAIAWMLMVLLHLMRLTGVEVGRESQKVTTKSTERSSVKCREWKVKIGSRNIAARGKGIENTDNKDTLRTPEK